MFVTCGKRVLLCLMGLCLGSSAAADVRNVSVDATATLLAADESQAKEVSDAAPAGKRRGISRTEEVAWIVGITVLIAFVIAWKLAARSEEDIKRLLNRMKSSTDPEEPTKAPEVSRSEGSTEQLHSDTVPEIPVVTGEDTDPEMPTTSST